MSKQKNPVGRPSKLTPELQEKLCRAVRLGNFLETAAALAGCTPRATQIWKKRGHEAGRGRYYDFAVAIAQAEAQGEALNVAIVQRAALRDWHAAQWFLERRFPERWAPKQKLQTEHTGRNGGPIETRTRIVKIRLVKPKAAE